MGNNPFGSLIDFIFDFYIFLFYIRMFTTTRERYDTLLGMVYRATDPVLRYAGSTFRFNQFNFAPLLVVALLLILKGLIFPIGIAGTFQNFFSFLFQAYALTLIIIMSYREYFVNPIVNFAQRLVNPIRALAANFSNSLLAVNVTSLIIVILLHSLVIFIFILNGWIGVEDHSPAKYALLKSLWLILNLTTFFIIVIIANALLTWFSPDPMNPLVQLLSLLSAPIVDPFRRFIPPLAGMLDLSPMAAIFALWFAWQVGASILALIFGSRLLAIM
ncbi:MAG: hypothetical protein ETSY2_32625 [Candidatus Entotheonella gemina]|uniref:YggT family protein n=1 Tax=Candidatus Entotheonella gemina TaxID=1429439 RepID=W4M1C7_9BACT|nr:MAG: hypothetical protein ETSY2_32625 [Candidatus Entotheonella gemina]